MEGIISNYCHFCQIGQRRGQSRATLIPPLILTGFLVVIKTPPRFPQAVGGGGANTNGDGPPEVVTRARSASTVGDIKRNRNGGILPDTDFRPTPAGGTRVDLTSPSLISCAMHCCPTHPDSGYPNAPIWVSIGEPISNQTGSAP